MAGIPFAGWLEILQGVLKFPGELLQLIRIIQKTPAEKHDDLVQAAAKESDKWNTEGRPTW